MVYCAEYLEAKRNFDTAREELEEAKHQLKIMERRYNKIWDTHIPSSKDGMADEAE